MFQYPAYFALCMVLIDIVLVAVLFKESLPQERRVSERLYIPLTQLCLIIYVCVGRLIPVTVYNNNYVRHVLSYY